MKRPCAPPTVMAAVAAPLGLAGRGSGIPLQVLPDPRFRTLIAGMTIAHEPVTLLVPCSAGSRAGGSAMPIGPG